MDLYCLNCLHSFKTENKLKPHENICKNKDFCGIAMPTEKNKVLKKQQQKTKIQSIHEIR